MSIYEDKYVVVGVDIIKEIQTMTEEEFNEIERIVNGSENLKMIYDGMNGDYCIIGKVLNHSYSNEDSLFKINYMELNKLTIKVVKEFYELFNKVYDAELIAFSHFY